MANELRNRLVPTTRKTLLIWTLLPLLLLTAVLYAYSLVSVADAQTTYQNDPSISPPKSTTAAQVGADIVVSWVAPAGQVDGYQIRRSKDSSNFSTLVENTGNTDTTYTDRPAASGRYKYRIKTIIGSNISPNGPKATVSFIATAAALLPTPEVEVETVVEEVTDEVAVEEVAVEEIAAEVTAETEIARLTSAIADQLNGCVMFDIDSPLGGDPTYAVNTDDVTCVPVRHVSTEPCIRMDLVNDLDTARITVYGEDGIPVALLTEMDRANLFGGKTLYSIGPFPTINDASHGIAKDYSALLFHNSGRGVLEVSIGGVPDRYETSETPDLKKTAIPDSYLRASKSFDVLDNDVYSPEMEFLFQRMKDIVDGTEYSVAPNCRFLPDTRDRISQPREKELLGNLTATGAVQDELDLGPDVDLFETTLTQGVEYTFTATAVDPNDVNINDVNFEINSTNKVLDLIAPTVQVMDADGDELASGDGAAEVSYTVVTGGTHYIRVSHATEADYDNAGVYTLSMRATGEGTGDFQGDNTTAALVETGFPMSGQISPANDVDWIKFEAAADQHYPILVTGDDTGGQTALADPKVTLHNADGTEVSASEYKTGTVNGQPVGELYTDTAGTYYIGVASNDSASGGAYIASIPTDDHPGLHNVVYEGFAVGGLVNGAINGAWDADRVEVSLINKVNYYVSVTNDAEADLTLTIMGAAGPVGETQADGSVYVEFVEGGIKAVPDAASGAPTAFTVQVSLSGTADTPVDYTITARTPQVADLTAADDHPDSIAVLSDAAQSLNLSQVGSHTLNGILNGSSDVDAFGIESMPMGEYQFHIYMPPTTAGLIGMQILLNKPDNTSEDITEGFTATEDLTTDAGYSISVTNHVPDTVAYYVVEVTPVLETPPAVEGS